MATDKSEYREVVLDPVPTGARIRHSLFSRALIGLIRLYQLTLSRSLPASCRFFPSCSQYTLEAIAKYGAVKGSWLGFKRILRCQPFGPSGYDPVP